LMRDQKDEALKMLIKVDKDQKIKKIIY
jgi:hypothetical protein